MGSGFSLFFGLTRIQKGFKMVLPVNSFFVVLFSHNHILIPYLTQPPTQAQTPQTPRESLNFKLCPVKTLLGLSFFHKHWWMSISFTSWRGRGKTGASRWRHSSIWRASGRSMTHMLYDSCFLALFWWMRGKALFLQLREEILQRGLSKRWAMLLSDLKHGKASVQTLVCLGDKKCSWMWFVIQFSIKKTGSQNWNFVAH